MEICDRKYKFAFGLSQNGQNMPKKGQQEKIFLCTINKGQLHRVHTKISTIWSITRELGIGNETDTFYHLYTFQFKKGLSAFLI